MYEHILNAANDAIWLCDRAKLDRIFAFLGAKSRGVSLDASTVQLAINERRQRQAPRTETLIGVLPVYGTISQRVGMIEEFSGGVSTEHIGRDFDMMLQEDSIGTIIMEFDTYGGTYPGIPELANKIYQARDRKRIVSHINAAAGSGGLWLAAAAGEVVITPSGEAGSVGAYVRHVDKTALNEDVGLKYEYISYGEHKTEGNPDEPMTDESRAFLQEKVDRIGKEFEQALAKFRGVSVAKVQKDFGRGRMLDAKRAVEVGMADRISTFEQTIQRTIKPQGRTGRKKVESLRRRVNLT